MFYWAKGAEPCGRMKGAAGKGVACGVKGAEPHELGQTGTPSVQVMDCWIHHPR
jgi:hypothetical protein